MAKQTKLILPSQSASGLYTAEDVATLYEYPHLLGWLAGKTKLGEIHSKWIRYIWDDKAQKGQNHRSLQAFRGSYKTTAAVVVGSVWYMLFSDPDARIFIIRKTFTDATEVLETIHQIMELPEIKALFEFVHGKAPKSKIKRKEKITYSFKSTITPEGNLNAYGLDGTITGKHGDKFILDDFVTIKDRVSRAERERTKDMIREISTNIVDPGKPVAYLGTPWHKQDAWEIVPRPIKFNVNHEETSHILTDEDKKQKRSTTTGSMWAANYLLEHVSDDDALFREPAWGKWRSTGIEGAVAQLDAAFDGDHWCALTIMARRSDGKLQGIGKTYNGNVKDWMPTVVDHCRKFGAKKIYIEDNADKGYTADELKGYGLSVGRYSESQNKHVKIATYLFEAWPNLIWDEDETDGEYMSQVLDYREKQEPDDSPDSAASLIRERFSTRKSARSERWKW